MSPGARVRVRARLGLEVRARELGQRLIGVHGDDELLVGGDDVLALVSLYLPSISPVSPLPCWR